MFDITLTVGPPSLTIPDSDNLEPGRPVFLEAAFPVVQVIPGPGGQPVPMAVGNCRIPIERDTAIQFGRTLVEEAEKLPKTSKLDIASSISEVEKAAQRMEQLTQP